MKTHTKTRTEERVDAKAMKLMSNCVVKASWRNGFYGNLAMKLELKIDRTCDTAWTDGKNLGFNPVWLLTLSKEEVIGLVIHEVLHCAFGHQFREGKRDHEVWNAACDYVVNLVIDADGQKLPPDGLFDTKYQGLTAEAVYKKLMTEREDCEQSDEDQGDQGEEQDTSPSEDSDNNQSEGGGEKSAETTADNDDGVSNTEKADTDKDGKPKPLPAGEVRPAPEEAPDEGEWMVYAETAHKMAQRAGTGGEGADRVMKELKQTSIDWRAVMQQFMTNVAKADYSMRRPNRRYLQSGMYLPSLRSEECPPIAFVIDTSGSMDVLALERCISEMISAMRLVNPERFVVIDVDYKVRQVREFDDVEEVEVSKLLSVRGGGGTRFAPGIDEAMKHEPCAIIYFTDGEASAPEEPEVPILWALSSEPYYYKTDTLPGEVLTIDEE